MQNRNSIIFAAACLALSACDNGGSSPPDAPLTVPPTTFSVSLSSMELTRTTTAEPVEIDTTGVGSGTLTLDDD